MNVTYLLISKMKIMIIKTKNGKEYDTEVDLTAPERHILQKLFLWESMASSVEEFNQKKETALIKGWNGSGPIVESDALRNIVRDLARKVSDRINPPFNK